MRISELAERSGLPIATIKFYLRERLLPPGEPVTTTRAEYGPLHLHRLNLVKVLSVGGMPIPKIRIITTLLDNPGPELHTALGRAVAALPPYPPRPHAAVISVYPRARAVLDKLGQPYDPSYPAVAQLDQALAAADSAGVPISERQLAAYGRHIRGIADADLSELPADPRAAIEYAVLCTAVYEPIIAAMRRLAHESAARELFSGEA